MTTQTPAEIVGDRIRMVRGLLQMTQEALAKRATVGQPFISRIERGLKIPSEDLQGRIADALSMSRTRLFAEVLDRQDGRRAA